MKMNVFVEDNETYIHVPVRSGLFQIQLDQHTVADFLADLEKTGRKRKSTVYRFVGLSKPPTRLSQQDTRSPRKPTKSDLKNATTEATQERKESI